MLKPLQKEVWNLTHKVFSYFWTTMFRNLGDWQALGHVLAISVRKPPPALTKLSPLSLVLSTEDQPGALKGNSNHMGTHLKSMHHTIDQDSFRVTEDDDARLGIGEWVGSTPWALDHRKWYLMMDSRTPQGCSTQVVSAITSECCPLWLGSRLCWGFRRHTLGTGTLLTAPSPWSNLWQRTFKVYTEFFYFIRAFNHQLKIHSRLPFKSACGPSLRYVI